MTRRERLQAKVDLRREWAAKRQAKANSLLAGYEQYRGDTAFWTQPGRLVARDRVISQVHRSAENASMANHHEAKADGLERQLASTIFSDDEDAVEALEAKVARLEAKRERMKLVNKAHAAYAKNKDALSLPKWTGLTEDERKLIASYVPPYSWEPHPFAPYQLQNLGGRIAAARKRILEVKERKERAEKASQAENGVLIEGDEWVRVTFPEKPSRDILNALRSAGFRWGGGSWIGKRADLPANIA